MFAAVVLPSQPAILMTSAAASPEATPHRTSSSATSSANGGESTKVSAALTALLPNKRLVVVRCTRQALHLNVLTTDGSRAAFVTAVSVPCQLGRGACLSLVSCCDASSSNSTTTAVTNHDHDDTSSVSTIGLLSGIPMLSAGESVPNAAATALGLLPWRVRMLSLSDAMGLSDVQLDYSARGDGVVRVTVRSSSTLSSVEDALRPYLRDTAWRTARCDVVALLRDGVITMQYIQGLPTTLNGSWSSPDRLVPDPPRPRAGFIAFHADGTPERELVKVFCALVKDSDTGTVTAVAPRSRGLRQPPDVVAFATNSHHVYIAAATGLSATTTSVSVCNHSAYVALDLSATSMAWASNGSVLCLGTIIGTVQLVAVPLDLSAAVVPRTLLHGSTDRVIATSLSYRPLKADSVRRVELPRSAVSSEIVGLQCVSEGSSVIVAATGRGGFAVLSATTAAVLHFVDGRESGVRDIGSLVHLPDGGDVLVPIFDAGSDVMLGVSADDGTPLVALGQVQGFTQSTRENTTTASTFKTSDSAMELTAHAMPSHESVDPWTLRLPADAGLFRPFTIAMDDAPFSAAFYDECLPALWSDTHFDHLRQLGSGAFGDVYLSRLKLPNMADFTTADDVPPRRYFAVKVSNLRNGMPSDVTAAATVERVLAQEALNVRRLPPHPHVLRHYGAYRCDTHQAVVMQPAVDTLDHVAFRRRPTEAKVRSWLAQLLKGLCHLHSHMLLHRDIKPENALVLQNGDLVWADFGVSLIAGDMQALAHRTVCGTMAYSAPEVVGVFGLASKAPYGPAADVWSLGAVFRCIVLQRRGGLMQDYSDVARVVEGALPPLFPTSLPEDDVEESPWSTELLQLIDSMMHHAPDQRPSARAALQSPLFSARLAPPRFGPISQAALTATSIVTSLEDRTGVPRDSRPQSDFVMARVLADGSTEEFTCGADANVVLRRTVVTNLHPEAACRLAAWCGSLVSAFASNRDARCDGFALVSFASFAADGTPMGADVTSNTVEQVHTIMFEFAAQHRGPPCTVMTWLQTQPTRRDLRRALMQLSDDVVDQLVHFHRHSLLHGAVSLHDMTVVDSPPPPVLSPRVTDKPPVVVLVGPPKVPDCNGENPPFATDVAQLIGLVLAVWTTAYPQDKSVNWPQHIARRYCAVMESRGRPVSPRHQIRIAPHEEL